jgi:hypothetical protein
LKDVIADYETEIDDETTTAARVFELTNTLTDQLNPELLDLEA